MMQTKVEWLASIDRWLNDFESTLQAWGMWLSDVEEAYLTGSFERLLELGPVGDSVHQQIQDAHRTREQILSEGSGFGFVGISLTSLIRWLGNDAPSNATVRLQYLSRQLKQMQQLSTSLWLTGFQSYQFTTSVLGLIATGSASQATYGDRERHEMEGGHLVDAAA